MTKQLHTSDSLAFLTTLDEFSNDIIYCDPPYALGSEVIIRKDGKVDYAKARIEYWKNTMSTQTTIFDFI